MNNAGKATIGGSPSVRDPDLPRGASKTGSLSTEDTVRRAIAIQKGQSTAKRMSLGKHYATTRDAAKANYYRLLRGSENERC
jgi:hypothetical protein